MKRSRCSPIGGALQEAQRDGGYHHHKSRTGRRNVRPKEVEGSMVARGEIYSSETEVGRGVDLSLNCSATLLPPPAGELRQHGWSLRLTPELLQLFSSEEGKNVKLAVQIEAQSGKLFVGDKVYELARLSSDMYMYSFGLVEESQITMTDGGRGGCDGCTCYDLAERSYATEKLIVKAERDLEFRRKMKERTEAAQAERSKNKIISIASQPVISKNIPVKQSACPTPSSKPREVTTTTQSKLSNKESSESAIVIVSGISNEDDYGGHVKDMRHFFSPNKITDRGVMVMSKLSDTGLLEIDPSHNGKLYVRFQTPEECAQALKRNGEPLKASGDGPIFTVKSVPMEMASILLRKALWLEAGLSIKTKLLANSMLSIVSPSSRDIPPISIPASEASYKELQNIRDQAHEVEYDLKRELSILDISETGSESQKDGSHSTSVRALALFRIMAYRILDVSLDDIKQKICDLNGAMIIIHHLLKGVQKPK